MEELIAYTENGKWGYRDRETNKILIPAQYDEVDPSAEELAKGPRPDRRGIVRVKLKDKWGARSVTNEELLPTVYDTIEIDYLLLRKYYTNDAIGIMDQAGNTIVPPNYNSARFNIGGWHLKLIGKKEGANDAIYILPLDYIEVSKGDKKGVFDIFGNEIIPVIYDALGFRYDDYNGDIMPACLNGKWGYINIDNEIIIPFIYDEAYRFHKYFAEVAMNGKYGLIDRKGNIIYPLVCDGIRVLDDDSARVKQNGEICYIDKTGKITRYCDENALLEEWKKVAEQTLKQEKVADKIDQKHENNKLYQKSQDEDRKYEELLSKFDLSHLKEKGIEELFGFIPYASESTYEISIFKKKAEIFLTYSVVKLENNYLTERDITLPLSVVYKYLKMFEKEEINEYS